MYLPFLDSWAYFVATGGKGKGMTCLPSHTQNLNNIAHYLFSLEWFPSEKINLSNLKETSLDCWATLMGFEVWAWRIKGSMKDKYINNHREAKAGPDLVHSLGQLTKMWNEDALGTSVEHNSGVVSVLSPTCFCWSAVSGPNYTAW